MGDSPQCEVYFDPQRDTAAKGRSARFRLRGTVGTCGRTVPTNWSSTTHRSKARPASAPAMSFGCQNPARISCSPSHADRSKSPRRSPDKRQPQAARRGLGPVSAAAVFGCKSVSASATARPSHDARLAFCGRLRIGSGGRGRCDVLAYQSGRSRRCNGSDADLGVEPDAVPQQHTVTLPPSPPIDPPPPQPGGEGGEGNDRHWTRSPLAGRRSLGVVGE